MEREPLRILVCSANLGNAQPDVASWNAWVPDDGRCSAILSNQKYPVRYKQQQQQSSHGNADAAVTPSVAIQYDASNMTDREQFDIIVFGLQESTFEPGGKARASVVSVGDSNQNDATAERHSLPPETNHTNNNHSRNSSTTSSSTTKRALHKMQKHTAAADGVVKKGLGVAKLTQMKTISAVQGLTVSRDHVKQAAATTTATTSTTSTTTSATSPNGGSGGLRSTATQQWYGGTHVLHQLMATRLPSYERRVSFQRGEMRLAILCHARHDVTVLHVAAQNTGRAGLANKGGIVAELLVEGVTRLSFFTAHLEAHEGVAKYNARVSTIADIFAGTRQKQFDCSVTAHYAFVMGDLNFRSELSNPEEYTEEEHKQIVRDMVAAKDWEKLNDIDELSRALANKECLVGFDTLFCNFPPTFKMERENGYRYVDKRRPSYTDRILWKASHGLRDTVRPLLYEPIDEATSSDHKPIRAAFAIAQPKALRLRPMLTRRGSVLNLNIAGRFKKRRNNEVQSPMACKERFHMFVTDMSCNIFTKDGNKRTATPNPYLVFISDPPEVLQSTQKKGMMKLLNHVKKSLVGEKGPATSAFVSAAGFPRSSIRKQTFLADWHDEEVHSEVRTHGADGMPFDLTGAMLRATVMDNRPSVEDIVVGTVVLNLADLIRSCSPSSEASSKNILARKVKRTVDATPAKRNSFQRGLSLIPRFRRPHEEEEVYPDEPSEHDNIEAMIVDEPIVKNGVETGRLCCSIEAWWMDEATSNVFNSSMESQRLSDRKSFGTTADGRSFMLSGRRQTKQQEGSGKRKR